MLTSGINRNILPEPGKSIGKVGGNSGSLAVYQNRQILTTRLLHHRRKGLVLSTGDRRRGLLGRKSSVAENSQMASTFRTKQNRTKPQNWSPETHEILVIALEKSSQFQHNFMAGDEIFIERYPLSPVSESVVPKDAEISEPSSDEDYIVHLTQPR